MSGAHNLFVFLGGSISVAPDGSGNLSFRDDDLDWEPAQDSNVDYRSVKLPASEMAAIRDHLTKHLSTTPSQGLDAATVERRAYRRAYAPLRSAQHALDIIARNPTGSAETRTLAREESKRIAAAIRALATEPHQHGGKA